MGPACWLTGGGALDSAGAPLNKCDASRLRGAFRLRGRLFVQGGFTRLRGRLLSQGEASLSSGRHLEAKGASLGSVGASQTQRRL